MLLCGKSLIAQPLVNFSKSRRLEGEVFSDCPVFPASGARHRENGGLFVVAGDADCWSSSSAGKGSINGTNLYSNVSNVHPLNNGNRGNGIPVRCVQVFTKAGPYLKDLYG